MIDGKLPSSFAAPHEFGDDLAFIADATGGNAATGANGGTSERAC
jgi:hypothetical protein